MSERKKQRSTTARTGAVVGKPATTGDTGRRETAAGNCTFARDVFRRAINAMHAELIARLECGR